eukprot:2449898-Heterocapsa_arctica.AAC.1
MDLDKQSRTPGLTSGDTIFAAAGLRSRKKPWTSRMALRCDCNRRHCVRCHAAIAVCFTIILCKRRPGRQEPRQARQEE